MLDDSQVIGEDWKLTPIRDVTHVLFYEFPTRLLDELTVIVGLAKEGFKDLYESVYQSGKFTTIEIVGQYVLIVGYGDLKEAAEDKVSRVSILINEGKGQASL